MITTLVKEKIDNSAFIKFNYKYNIDTKNKTISVSLKDTNKREKLSKVVDKAENTGPKQTLSIRNKYKNVIIEIKFS
jgi:hypothetical protein